MIKNKLIIINKNNKNKLIKLKYSIILKIIFEPIILNIHLYLFSILYSNRLYITSIII